MELPAANAFLERMFSTATWFDDLLRQNLGHDRFEMGVLLGVNQDLRRFKLEGEYVTVSLACSSCLRIGIKRQGRAARFAPDKEEDRRPRS